MKRLAVLYIALFLLILPAAGKAGSPDNSEDALILKTRNRAENARPDDWKTLADCARNLLDQRILCRESLTWLERSLTIDSNYYNLTIMGDYYRLSLDFTKANENYILAILAAQKEGRMDVISSIQWKILITQGTRNYYNFYQSQSSGGSGNPSR